MPLLQREIYNEFIVQTSNKWVKLLAPTENQFPRELPDDIAPIRNDIFKAFCLVEPKDVRLVMLGLDPYPCKIDEEPVATGVAFDLETPSRSNRSFHELQKSLFNYEAGQVRCLKCWAKEKRILLLNVALTIPKGGASGAHLKEWEDFVTHVIACLARKNKVAKYWALGKKAQKVLERGLKLGGADAEIRFCYHPAFSRKDREKYSPELYFPEHCNTKEFADFFNPFR